MPVILMIIAGIPLLSLAWWWWARRRLRALGAGRGWRIFTDAMMVLLLSGFVWVMCERRDVLTTRIPPQWYAAVLLWGLIFLPLLALPSMVGWSVVSLVRRIFVRKPRVAVASEGKSWSRRKWLGAAAVTLPALATFGTTIFTLPRMTRFRIRKMTLAVDGLPAALDGLRIAHVTDTHVGKFTRGHVLDEIVDATNRLEADLILFTGDLIDNRITALPSAVGMLQRMRAKSGLFLIEGNHDLFDDPAAFVDGVRAGGLKILRNEAALIDVRGVAVQLLGLVWHHGEEAIARDVGQLAALRDPAAFPILLAHHPHAFDPAAELGFPLVLAGHTHGGQLMLTQDKGAGPLMFRYWSGLYRKAASQLVVGNGTGNWFPLRLHAPAEIIELTLKSAGDYPGSSGK